MKLIRIGVDLAKNIFQLHGVDREEKAVFKRRLKRDQWLRAVFDNAEPGCEIGMEACGGAHHWARGYRQVNHFGRNFERNKIFNPLISGC